MEDLTAPVRADAPAAAGDAPADTEPGATEPAKQRKQRDPNSELAPAEWSRHAGEMIPRQVCELMVKQNRRAPAGAGCYVSWHLEMFIDAVEGGVLKRGKYLHAGSSHIMSQMGKESDHGTSLCVAQYKHKLGTYHLDRNAGAAAVEPKKPGTVIVKHVRTGNELEDLATTRAMMIQHCNNVWNLYREYG